MFVARWDWAQIPSAARAEMPGARKSAIRARRDGHFGGRAPPRSPSRYQSGRKGEKDDNEEPGVLLVCSGVSGSSVRTMAAWDVRSNVKGLVWSTSPVSARVTRRR